MAIAIFRASDPKHRARGNRIAGKCWLVIIFLTLVCMTAAVAFLIPYLGKFARFYQGALFISMIWDTVLLAAIWKQQGWARVVLAGFLLSFVAGVMVYIPNMLLYYPSLRGDGLHLILLHCGANFLAAIFLIFSLDIRWLERPSNE